MRKIVIISILVILMINIVPVSTGEVSTSGTSSGYVHNLNFNSYKIGSYPDNLSWVNFHNVSAQQSTEISVQNSSFGRGLLVSTTAYHNGSDSYLDTGMKFDQNFTVKITFSWSTNNSLSQTGDNILFDNGAKKILQYQFGSYYNYDLYLSTNKTFKLGGQPSTSELYTLQISGSRQTGDVFTSLVSGYNKTSHTPILLKNNFAVNNYNYSFLFGGAFSRLTIYNIYVNNSINGFTTFKTGSSRNFNVTNISSVYFSGLNSRLFAKPLVDWRDNSIIYATKQTGAEVYSYNFYNNTQRDLLSLKSSQELISTAGTTYNGYLLIEDGTSLLIEAYNYTTGLISNYHLNDSVGLNAKLYISQNTVFIQSTNGTLWIFNTSTGSATTVYSHIDGFIPVHSWIFDHSFITEFYNNTTGNLTVFEVSQNGKRTELATDYLGEVDYEPSFVIDASSLLSSSSSYLLGNTHTHYQLMGDTYLPYVTDSNFSVINGTGSNVFVGNSNNIDLFYNGSLEPTNVNTNSQFVSFDSNVSRGLSVTNNTITLYSKSNDLYSPDNISIESSVPGILRGNVSIHYTVRSKVNYSISAKLGNKSLNADNDSIYFPSTNFGNGTYVFFLKATNIAGYTSIFRKTVYVDNYKPVVRTNPNNGSLLFSGSQIEFTISSISGSTYTTVTEQPNVTLVFSGYSFIVTVPEYTGRVNFTLKIVDQFGLSHNFNYSFHIENFNNTGYTSDIIPGAYLPNGSINLTWTGVQFASYYNITLIRNGERENIRSSENLTQLDLLSGLYFLDINATTSSHTNVVLVEETFTVQSFNPSLTVNRTSGEYFSFYGNSPNQTLEIMARANVTSRFWLNATYENQSHTFYNGNGTYINYTIEKALGLFEHNGLYNVSITAQEKSGRTTSFPFIISVNNSIPSLIHNNETLYFNSSLEHLPLVFQSNTTYWYNLNGDAGNNITLNSPHISLESKSNSILLHALNKWGNYNQTLIHIIYSGEKPVISLTVSPHTLIWSRNFTVSYNVTDPVKLSKVVLMINNQGNPLRNNTTGTFNYTVSGDGNFSFSLMVSDESGNNNISKVVNVTSYYFPEIKSINPNVKTFLGIAYLSAGIQGKDLQSVNITWNSGGNLIGKGINLWTFAMPGTHVYTLTLHYHSRKVTVARSVFTLGFIPELLAGFVISALILYRKYSGRTDIGLSKDLIKTNLGKSKSEIYRIGKKSGLRRSTISETMGNMQKSKEIVLMKDPDGIIYLMDPGSIDE